MKTRLLSLAFFLCCLVSAGAQMTNITAAANSISIDGVPVNGTLSIVGVDSTGRAVPVHAVTGGLDLPSAKLGAGYASQCVIASGGITGSCSVPDAATANGGVGIHYNLLISDQSLGQAIPLTQVPNITGASWALDAYVPTVTVATPVASSYTLGSGNPVGSAPAASLYLNTVNGNLWVSNSGSWVLVQGAQGQSAYQIAVANGFTGTQTQWLASLQGAPGQNGVTTLAQLAAGSGAADSDVYSALGMAAGRNRLSSWAVGGLSCPSGTFTAGSPSYFQTSGYIYIADLSSFSANFTVGNGTSDPSYAIYDQNFNELACISAGQAAGYSFPNVAGGFYVRIEAGLQLTPTGGAGPLWVGGGVTPASTAPAYGYVYPDSSYVGTLKASLPNPALLTQQQSSTSAAIDDAAQPLVRNLFDPARSIAGLTFDLVCYNNPTYYTAANGGPYGACVSPYESQSSSNGQVGSILIPVVPGSTLYLTQPNINGNSNQGNIFYDANKVPIRSTFMPQPITAGVITVPLTATPNTGTTPVVPAYLRIFVSSSYSSAMLLSNTGTAYSGPYIPFAQTPSTTQSRSPWSGRTVELLTDSYGAAYAYAWLNAFLNYHNLRNVLADMRSGRPIGSDAATGQGAFECYPNGSGSPDPINGTFSGSLTPSQGYGTCATACPLCVNGNTFKQNMTISGVPDLFLVVLGMNTYSNDVSVLGSTTDAVGAATLHGQIKLILNGIHTASPTTRLIWMEPPSPTDTQLSRNTAVPVAVQAIEQECALYGDPVLKYNSESGINPVTAPTLLRDGIHETDQEFSTGYAGYLEMKLQNIPPLH